MKLSYIYGAVFFMKNKLLLYLKYLYVMLPNGSLCGNLFQHLLKTINSEAGTE